MNTFTTAVLASALAGASTGLGAVPLFFFRSFPARVRDGFLGFSAGIMLAATAFSLIVPGLRVAATTAGEVRGAFIMAGGILLGGLVLWLVDVLTPHEHAVMGMQHSKRIEARRIRRVWLFVLAVTLHNFPEGLAVGAGYAAGDPGRGAALSLGIGIQNIPEGFAVAVSLLGLQGMTRARAGLIALGSGLVEPVGALVGAGVVTASLLLLPWGLGFAAGAMLFIISDEIIPETHANGNEKIATAGLFIGFVLMMILDVTLG